MQVVKLGGSLNREPRLREWLQLIATAGAGAVVLVPGGGGFADQVREHQAQWRFDDLAAHNMAILAMMQSAILLQRLSRGLELASTASEISRVLQSYKVPVWSPSEWLCGEAGNMTHWGATSDSLAAWLAGRMGARRLVLVKSCEIDRTIELAQQVERGVLDADFCRVAAGARYSIELLGINELPRMRTLLSN